MDKIKFFIFSDESGSWHDEKDVYVRSWIVITEEESKKLLNKIDEIISFLGSNELSWKTLAGNSKYFSYFTDLSFRIFITVSSPKDIKWETKYYITKDFDSNIKNFNFGELEPELKIYVKDRILRDIKNALFLNFYEKHHIENAKKGIERVIKPTEYDLIYRVDPPQMSQDGWKKILYKIGGEGINIEFPKSSRTQGIQFADIVAGCFRSLFIKDENYDKACEFFNLIKSKLISKNKDNPNPNLIFWGEINSDLKKNCAEIWKL
jgi:hypothetical protein